MRALPGEAEDLAAGVASVPCPAHDGGDGGGDAYVPVVVVEVLQCEEDMVRADAGSGAEAAVCKPSVMDPADNPGGAVDLLVPTAAAFGADGGVVPAAGDVEVAPDAPAP